MAPAHRVYIGTIGQGVWRSADGGESFVRASDGMFVECYVRALTVDPRDPRVLHAGTEQGLYRTSDGADNWQRVESPLNGRQILVRAVTSCRPKPDPGGTCPSRIFRSEDGGQSWDECAAVLEQHCPRIMNMRVTCFAADPDDPETLWAGVEIDGIRRSRDGGRSWEKIGNGLGSQDIHALALVPSRHGQGRRMLAATNRGLDVSEDGGESWQPLPLERSLPWTYCRALQQPCGRRFVVLLGNGNGPPGSAGVVGRSDDGGVTWHPAVMPGHSNSTIWNFAVHPSDPEMIYAASVSGEVYRSLDGGLTWGKLAREFGEIRALVWAP